MDDFVMRARGMKAWVSIAEGLMLLLLLLGRFVGLACRSRVRATFTAVEFHVLLEPT